MFAKGIKKELMTEICRSTGLFWIYKDLFHRGKSTGEHMDVTAVNRHPFSKEILPKKYFNVCILQHQSPKCNCYYPVCYYPAPSTLMLL